MAPARAIDGLIQPAVVGERRKGQREKERHERGADREARDRDEVIGPFRAGAADVEDGEQSPFQP